MTVCNRCGKENQDHYKFCLGCGAELKAAAPAGDAGNVAMMRTVMQEAPHDAPQGGRPRVSSTPPAGSSRPAMSGMPPAGPLSSDPGPARGRSPSVGGMENAPGYSPPIAASQPDPSARRCPSCATNVPVGFRFCGSCGTRMEEVIAPAQPPVEQAIPKRGRLSMTLIRPDGSEGGTHDLTPGENKIGRNFGAIFENDGYLSPSHATIEILGNRGVVRDLDSLNGVFVKMTGEEELHSGQIVRIGQELLRYETIVTPEPSANGTELMGSPNPGFWGKLTVIIGRGATGAAFPLLGESVTLGRERGEINFPDDGYVSGLHARVTLRDGHVYLADLGSSNGTFIKVNGERPIGHESYVLLGQQLFRLNLS